MTLLKGGVSHNVGSTGGGVGGFDPMSIAISETKNEVDRKKQNIQNSLGSFANGMTQIASSVGNFTPNFQPISGGYIAPQQMQTQQSTMPSLYKYLVS